MPNSIIPVIHVFLLLLFGTYIQAQFLEFDSIEPFQSSSQIGFYSRTGRADGDSTFGASLGDAKVALSGRIVRPRTFGFIPRIPKRIATVPQDIYPRRILPVPDPLPEIHLPPDPMPPLIPGPRRSMDPSDHFIPPPPFDFKYPPRYPPVIPPMPLSIETTGGGVPRRSIPKDDPPFVGNNDVVLPQTSPPREETPLIPPPPSLPPRPGSPEDVDIPEIPRPIPIEPSVDSGIPPLVGNNDMFPPREESPPILPPQSFPPHRFPPREEILPILPPPSFPPHRFPPREEILPILPPPSFPPQRFPRREQTLPVEPPLTFPRRSISPIPSANMDSPDFPSMIPRPITKDPTTNGGAPLRIFPTEDPPFIGKDEIVQPRRSPPRKPPVLPPPLVPRPIRPKPSARPISPKPGRSKPRPAKPSKTPKPPKVPKPPKTPKTPKSPKIPKIPKSPKTPKIPNSSTPGQD